MDYEIEYSERFEEEVKEIRDAALKKAQLTNPDIKFVIDSRPMDEYCNKTWDYPGKWYYSGFRLPEGFRDKNELIDAIAADTVRYFDKGKRKSFLTRLFKK